MRDAVLTDDPAGLMAALKPDDEAKQSMLQRRTELLAQECNTLAKLARGHLERSTVGRSQADNIRTSSSAERKTLVQLKPHLYAAFCVLYIVVLAAVDVCSAANANGPASREEPSTTSCQPRSPPTRSSS